MRPHHRGSRFAAHGRPLTYACVCGYLIFFSAPLATAQGSSRPVARPSARNGGILGLLDRPLPGTPERELYDCCERLRSSLAFCDGVQAVRVSAATPPGGSPDAPRLDDRPRAPPARPLFVIQISFLAQAPPPHLRDLSRLCMLQVPGLTRDQLAFVDSSGRALVETAEPVATPSAAPAALRAVADFRQAYVGLGGGAAVLCLVAVALAVRRRPPVSKPPGRTPATTAQRVAPEALASHIAALPPAIAGAALAALEPDPGGAVRGHASELSTLPTPERPMHAEVRAVVEAAIRDGGAP